MNTRSMEKVIASFPGKGYGMVIVEIMVASTAPQELE